MEKNKIQKENEKLIKKLDPLLLALEISAAKKIVRFLKSTEKELITDIERIGNVNLWTIELTLQNLLRNRSSEFQKLITGVIEDGGKFGANQVLQDLKRHEIYAGLKLSDIHPKVSEELLRRKQNWASEKMKQMGDNLTTILQNGYADGKGIDDIAKDIKDQFKITQGQASTIARTEINGAKNEVAFQNLQELGIEKKEWSSAGDMRVRPSHVDVDGEVVGINETFSNGLLYPHDPNGPAEEVINCRCSVLSYME